MQNFAHGGNSGGFSQGFGGTQQHFEGGSQEDDLEANQRQALDDQAPPNQQMSGNTQNL